MISIVSPVYRAEKLVPLLVDQVKSEMEVLHLEYEIILVEDGSSDKSWKAIEIECINNKKVMGLKLSRNFGQHYAITAGLDFAQGDWIVVMDCDLQDRPSEIRKLLHKAYEGFDIVLARREIRNDAWWKKTYSGLFYKLLGYLTGTKQDPGVANFGIYNKQVIDSIKSMRESIRYFPTMIKWVGFNSTTVVVEHGTREIGKTTYDFNKRLHLAFDIILAYSDKPIRLTIKFGFLVALMSFLFGLYTLFKYFTGQIIVLGYTSLIISIFFVGGLILMVLGVIGLYIGKTFEGVKNRPIYIIQKKMN